MLPMRGARMQHVVHLFFHSLYWSAFTSPVICATGSYVNVFVTDEYCNFDWFECDIVFDVHVTCFSRGHYAASREWALLCRTAETVLGPTGSSLVPPDQLRPLVSRKSTAYRLPELSADASATVDSRFGVSRHGWTPLERAGTLSTFSDMKDSYEFPGFCSGCRRQGGWTFCYGCERDGEPQ